MSLDIWPDSALTIIDAGDSMPMQSIVMTYTDPSDATRTASVTLTRTAFLPEYILAHPGHIDLPLDTFIAVRLIPDNGSNWPLSVWIYGGCNVVFDPIMTGDPPEPVLDGEGYPTYTVTRTGRPGPDLAAGNLYPIINPFDISSSVPLDAPWGARAEFISMGSALTNLDQPYHLEASGVDFTHRPGVQWFSRVNAEGNPLVVPLTLWNFTRCDRLRSNLGGANEVGVPANIRIDGARRERGSRRLTYDSATSALTAGMYLSHIPRQHGYGLAETQVAALFSGGIIMAGVPEMITGRVAFVGALECLATIDSLVVECDDTSGLAPDDELVWGDYDVDTDTWTPGSEVVAEIEGIIDGTHFRLKALPICWYGTMWVHDGDVTVGGSDEAVNVAADGFSGTPDGKSATVSA